MVASRSTSTGRPPVVPDGTYRAIGDQSWLEFKAKAFGLAWVHGRMPAISGFIEIRDGRLRGSGRVSADRVDTGLRPRDWHLRSRHYLNTSTFPEIHLSVEEVPVAAGAAECTVVVRGTSAIVSLELDDIEVLDGVLRLSAHGTVDRTAYPMWPPIAGVSRLVHVGLSVVASPDETATR
jgi:polyisoprenoid-binding protein YceI